MALAAKLYRLDNRQSDRFAVAVDATIRAASARPMDASVTDLSETGFCAELDQEMPIGAAISIGLPGVGVIEACVMRRDGDRYGCKFLVPLTRAAIARATADTPATIVSFPPAPAPLAMPAIGHLQGTDMAAAVDARLPIWMSIVIIGGSSVLLWSAIIGAIHAVVA